MYIPNNIFSTRYKYNTRAHTRKEKNTTTQIIASDQYVESVFI